MEYLQTWLDNSEIPIITAFLLGLLTAVSPCPFIGYQHYRYWIYQ